MTTVGANQLPGRSMTLAAAAAPSPPLSTASASCASSNGELLGAGERPDVGRVVGRVADPVGADDVDERGDERVPHRFVHVDPLGRAARLPAVVERAFGDRERGFLGVDVVAHVRRVLAAELELHPHEPVRGRAGDLAARSRTSR